MRKLSLVLGVIATLLYASAQGAMFFLVHGEKDWDLGIALVLSILVAIGMSFIGVILSLASFDSSPRRRTLSIVSLVLNLIPGALFLVCWIASRILIQ